MGSVPVPRTFNAGEVETAAYLNSLSQALSFLLSPPRAKVYATAAQSLATATYTAVLFDSEEFDTDSMHSTTTSTSRLTINTPGLYEVRALLNFVANGSGVRYGRFYKNNAVATPAEGVVAGIASAGTVTAIEMSSEIQCAAGDYLEVFAYQSSGAALNLQNTGGFSCQFSAHWIASS